jgi:TM2 domain-containing membrane protein YozV
VNKRLLKSQIQKTMKNIFTISLIAVFVFLFSTNAHAVIVGKQQMYAQQQIKAQGYGDLSIDEFLALTPKAVKEKTGKGLGIKGTIALKMAQNQVRHALENPDAPAGSSKSQVVALVLVALLGGLGIHRFYLGYTTIGIIQLLTLGGCGVWALIDLIRIITGTLKPADGSNYDPEL